MSKKIVAFGNPLLDTIVFIKDDILLKKYNLENDGQKEISLSEMMSLRKDIRDCEKVVTAGGCAQNTLRVLQWLFQKQCVVTVIGGIGVDEDGINLEEILKKHEVETCYILNSNYSTGTTISLVNNEYRSLVAYLGAAEVVSLDDVKKNSHIISQIEEADLIYMEGFFLTKRIETAYFILNYCNSLNKQFAFNLCGKYLCKENAELIKCFIEKANIIFGNKNEFEALLSIMNEHDTETLLKTLVRKGKIVTMTNGSNSVLSGGNFNNFFETEVIHLRSEEIVDTTGAGDAFAAGFLTGYLTGNTLKICSKLGCYTAQEIIKRRGCTVPEHPPKFSIT